MSNKNLIKPDSCVSLFRSSDIAMKALTDLLATMDTVSVLFKTPLPVAQKGKFLFIHIIFQCQTI